MLGIVEQNEHVRLHRVFIAFGMILMFLCKITFAFRIRFSDAKIKCRCCETEVGRQEQTLHKLWPCSYIFRLNWVYEKHRITLSCIIGS
jgi:hypothetical protein